MTTTSSASAVVTALDGLLTDILGSRLSAADKAKLTLYSGIVAMLLDAALPAIDGKIDWAAIESGIAQVLSGIDATYTAISRTPATGTETSANA